MSVLPITPALKQENTIFTNTELDVLLGYYGSAQKFIDALTSTVMPDATPIEMINYFISKVIVVHYHGWFPKQGSPINISHRESYITNLFATQFGVTGNLRMNRIRMMVQVYQLNYQTMAMEAPIGRLLGTLSIPLVKLLFQVVPTTYVPPEPIITQVAARINRADGSVVGSYPNQGLTSTFTQPSSTSNVVVSAPEREEKILDAIAMKAKTSTLYAPGSTFTSPIAPFSPIASSSYITPGAPITYLVSNPSIAPIAPIEPLAPMVSSAPIAPIAPLASTTSTSSKVEVVPISFTGAGKIGDFKWMINQPAYQQDLFIFNDNEEANKDYMDLWVNNSTTSVGLRSACVAGMGNAVIRPYRCIPGHKDHPRSAGLPTGYLSGIGTSRGYATLSEAQQGASVAMDYITSLVKSGQYRRVYFSVGPDGLLGQGVFDIDRDVRVYFTKFLLNLANV